MTRLSYAAAVRRKCRECIYDRGAPGTWLQQVGECSSVNCALHGVRPMPSVGRDGKPTSPRAEAPDEPAPTVEPEPDVNALFDGLFGAAETPKGGSHA